MTAPAAHLGGRDFNGDQGTEPREAAVAAPEACGVVSLRLEGLRKSFGTCRAVDGVTLDVFEGELLAILGPSGCGKSTLLRLVAGLERQDAGRIMLHGRDVGNLPPAARGCGVVFQSYALFPNLTAAQNVAFGVDRRRHRRAARVAKAAALLGQVGLGDVGGRYPAQLSGGQQQRVALARALATEPALLLLDEPLSALDAKVRAMLRVEIRRLQQATKLTTLLVTHDQEEAMTMADRVAVMSGGRLVQVDSPRAVYQRPADAFTASFVGAMNFLPGWQVGPGGTVRREGVSLRLGDGAQLPAGTAVTVAFRPEEAELHVEGARENVLPCRVERVEFRGAFVRYYLVVTGASTAFHPLPPGEGPGEVALEVHFDCRAPSPLPSPGGRGGKGPGVPSAAVKSCGLQDIRGDVVILDVPAAWAARHDLRAGAGAGVLIPTQSVRVFPDAGAAR